MVLVKRISSASTLYRTMKRLCFTRKRLKFVALQRSDVPRAEFQAEVSMYNSNMFLFVDETGCDRKDAARKYSVDFQPTAFNFVAWKTDFNNWANVNNHFFRLLHN